MKRRKTYQSSDPISPQSQSSSGGHPSPSAMPGQHKNRILNQAIAVKPQNAIDSDTFLRQQTLGTTLPLRLSSTTRD